MTNLSINDLTDAKAGETFANARTLEACLARLPRGPVPGKYESCPRIARVFDLLAQDGQADRSFSIGHELVFVFIGPLTALHLACVEPELGFALTDNERFVLREMDGAILTYDGRFCSLMVFAFPLDLMEALWRLEDRAGRA
jgi:hypothetical protein